MEEARLQALYKGAKPSEIAVYEFLRKQGWRVLWVSEHDEPKPGKLVRKFRLGDLAIIVGKRLGRIQVKQDLDMKFDFHCVSDWKTRQIFIDSKNHVYKTTYKWPLVAYAIVNPSNTGMFWIPCRYRQYWRIADVENGLVEHNVDTVAMPSKHLKDLYFDFKEGKRLPQHLIHIDGVRQNLVTEESIDESVVCW